MSEDRKLPKPPAPVNGAAAIGAPRPQPRRQTDDPGSDYRYVRAYHPPGHGGNGGYGAPITAAMVSLAIGAIMLAANWLGFTRGEIDRALSPLQSAHGRLDDRVSREIQRLDAEKVDNAIQLQVAAEMNRRLAAIERVMELQSERAQMILQKIGKLEANGDPDYDGSR